MSHLLSLSKPRLAGLAICAVAVGLVAAGCGSSTKPKPVSFKATQSGKTVTLQVPKKIDGGLTAVTFTNASKQPADAQLVRLDGGHTPAEALKITESNGPTKIPSWIHGEGGVGTIPPGKSLSATMDLPAGSYMVLDDSQQNGPGSGPPPYTQLTAGSGSSGDLPSTSASITAAVAGKDKYKWEISGLHAGANQITFNSKGKDALHNLAIFPVNGNATVDQIKKALASNGPPKGTPPIDFNKGEGTTVLDGGSSLTTTVNLKAGKYAFICFLQDRDHPKPHFLEGLLKEEDVK